MLSESRREVLLCLSAFGLSGATSASPVFTTKPQLSASEARTLAAAGDALVPGAAKAGIATFVSAMLASHRPALFYDYLSLPDEPAVFYRTALKGIHSFALLHRGHAFDALPVDDRQRLLRTFLLPRMQGWSGPPPTLVYTVLRNDAIDVVYGTESAYENLNIPYMPHIKPPRLW